MQLRHGSIVAVSVLAVVGCGLMGGILFAFSNFVMTALRSQPAASGIRAMQAINSHIVNPLFLVLFIGTPLAAAFLAFVAARCLAQPGAKLLLAGSATYLAGTLVVTVACNIPLNNRLAAHDPESAEAARYWIEYVSEWMTWNHVRTCASLAATVLLALGISRGQEQL